MKGRQGEAGYVLFGIAVVIVVMGIFLVAAVPYWQKVVQREREQELIFRGYQYMRAVELYQQKFPGAFPPNVDMLVEQKFLRKPYKDPFTGEDFKIIRQLSPEMQVGANRQQGTQGRNTGVSDINRSRARMRSPGSSSTAGQTGAMRSATGQRLDSGPGRGGNDQGLVGVASASDEKPFYEVPGKEKYSDWLFVLGAQPAMPGAAASGLPGKAATGVPGAGAAGTIPPPLKFYAGAQPQQPGRGQPGVPGGNVPGATPQPRPPGSSPGASPFQPGTGQRPGFPGQTQPQDPRRRRPRQQ